MSSGYGVDGMSALMMFPGRLNCPLSVLRRPGEHGASHPQQIDLSFKSTALESQTNGPSEPVPHRLK